MGSVLQKFDADASAVEKELAKMRREYDKLLQKVDEVGRHSERSSRKQESGWDRNLTKLASVAGSYVSINSIIQAGIDAQARMNELIKESADVTQRLSQQRMVLSQVSSGGQEFKKYNTKARELSAKHGISQEESLQLVFDAISQGFYDEVDAAGQAGEVVGTRAAAQLMGKVKNLFKGQINGRQAVSGAVAAAGRSDVDVGGLAGELPGVVAASSGLGARPEELIGAVGLLSSFSGSASEGATELENLLRKLAMKGSAGGVKTDANLGSIVDQLSAMSPAQFQKIFGDDAGSRTAARKLIDNRSELKGYVSAVSGAFDSAGSGSDPIAQKLAARYSDPIEFAARNRRLSDLRLEIAKERELSSFGSDRVVASNNLSNALIRSRLGPIQQYAGSTVGNAAGFLGMDGAVVGTAAAELVNGVFNASGANQALANLDAISQGRTPSFDPGGTGAGSAINSLREVLGESLLEQKKLNRLIEQQEQQRAKDKVFQRAPNPLAQQAAHNERG